MSGNSAYTHTYTFKLLSCSSNHLSGTFINCVVVKCIYIHYMGTPYIWVITVITNVTYSYEHKLIADVLV